MQKSHKKVKVADFCHENYARMAVCVQTTEEVYDAIEQRVKNRLQEDMSASADYAIDVETMRARLHRMVHEVYSMP